jgi:hypothetical protein
MVDEVLACVGYSFKLLWLVLVKIQIHICTALMDPICGVWARYIFIMFSAKL